MRESIKHDQGKAPLTLVDPDFTEGLAYVLEGGDAEYGPGNWRTGTGLVFTRVLNSMKRHIADFERGIDLDAKSGRPHMHHASSCAMFLQYYINNGWTHLDDRPYKKAVPGKVPGMPAYTTHEPIFAEQSAETRPPVQDVLEQAAEPATIKGRNPDQVITDGITDRVNVTDHIRTISHVRGLYAGLKRGNWPTFPILDDALETYPVKCDGDHGGPQCGDPQCWNDEGQKTGPEGEPLDRFQALQQWITRWADSVYPNRTPEVAFAKMLGEVAEILANPSDELEWADVLILLLDAAHLRGIDLVAVANRKMEINEERVWAIDKSTGIMSHIKSTKGRKSA